MNVNGFNSLFKWYQLACWIFKQEPILHCLQERYLISTNKHWSKVKVWKNMFQANGSQKQAGET
jgi:hypothetical protein